MVKTKKNWSGSNVIHFGRKSQFGPDQFIMVKSKKILDRPKLFWTDQNCFGQKEGQGKSEYF